MITREFLKSKVDENQYWKAATSGNVYKLAETIYQFMQYNFLGGGDSDMLDGHYSFVVDIENFNYLVYKDSDYGGLTWVTDIENKVFTTINEKIKVIVESIIAQKLLRSYYFSSKDVCHRGDFLIPTPEYAGLPYDFKQGKYHLICTWVDDYPDEPLGQLEEIEKLAVRKLKDLQVK